MVARFSSFNDLRNRTPSYSGRPPVDASTTTGSVCGGRLITFPTSARSMQTLARRPWTSYRLQQCLEWRARRCRPPTDFGFGNHGRCTNPSYLFSKASRRGNSAEKRVTTLKIVMRRSVPGQQEGAVRLSRKSAPSSSKPPGLEPGTLKIKEIHVIR